MRRTVVGMRQSPHLGCEERVMRQDEESSSICTAEDELQGTLGHLDLRDLLAGRRVDEDLAIGYIDIAVAIDGNTFASTLCKGLEIC